MNECYKYGMAHGCDKFCPVLQRGACLLCELKNGEVVTMKTNKTPKNKPIPKLPANRFIFENWNAGYCENFFDLDTNKEFIRKDIIGWCPSSRVLARPRNDDEFIAIMLKDNTWCHFPVWGLKDECEDNISFWNFEGLGDENTN